MKVLSIITGAILMLCGIGCAVRPGQTFLSSGYMIAVLLFVYGIAGIVKAVSSKKFGLEFAVSIIGTIVGVIALFRPASTLVIDGILIYFTAFFFVAQGISSIMISFKLKKAATGKKWIFGVITGILALILGIYSFIHPLSAALTIGFLIGFYFIEAGINMIVLAVSAPEKAE